MKKMKMKNFKKWIKKNPIWSIIIGIFLLLIIMGIFNGNGKENDDWTNGFIEHESRIYGSKEIKNNILGDIINTVTRVIDGDTIEIETGERVRLIGINSPEKGEKCYQEAKDFLEGLILNKEISLESDVEDKDQYGRLLRYVFFEEHNLNYGMIYLGLAHKYEYGSNTKYSSLFKEAEDKAKENEGCLWKSEEINYIQDKCIYVTNSHFNAGGDDNYNLNDEYVIFSNKCDYSIKMNGWTIKDETAFHIYTIPSFTSQAKSTFTLYTGIGKDTSSALYWGRTSGDYGAIWNNNGDTLFLRDSNGNLVLSQSYSGY